MIRKRILLIGTVLIMTLGTLAGSFYLSFNRPNQNKTLKKDLLLETLIKSKDESKLPQTGDILLWSNTTIDSLVIQQLTDGPYSHCGMIRKDPSGKVWVMDTYPEEGLRYIPLKIYLHPKDLELVNLCLIRYKGQIHHEVIESKISLLNKQTHNINFDRNVILEDPQMSLVSLSSNPHSIYCAELVYLILKDATEGPKLFDNDYDRVMSKWDQLSEKSRKQGLNPLEYVKLFYMKMNLYNLRDDPQKTLISPNGFLRSNSFLIVSEIKDLVKPNYFKKFLTRLPHSNHQSSNPNQKNQK